MNLRLIEQTKGTKVMVTGYGQCSVVKRVLLREVTKITITNHVITHTNIIFKLLIIQNDLKIKAFGMEKIRILKH